MERCRSLRPAAPRGSPKTGREPGGFILVTVLLMISLLLTLLAGYYQTTSVETTTTALQRGTSSGFFAAEAGLNARAEDVRQLFLSYNIPVGTAPSSSRPCSGANVGSGTYACRSTQINNRDVTTWIQPNPPQTGAPTTLRIPSGEKYAGLMYMSSMNTAKSRSTNKNGDDEAVLDLVFDTRVVPLFQFAAFYNKDLEILPGPDMTLNGPVHSNMNIFLNSDATLSIGGQVTAAGRVYRGRKNADVRTGAVRILTNLAAPTSYAGFSPSGSGRSAASNADLTGYNGNVQQQFQPLSVPAPADVLSPRTGVQAWDLADLRLQLFLNPTGAPAQEIRVMNPAGTVNAAATAQLGGCTRAKSGGHPFPGNAVVARGFMADRREQYNGGTLTSAANSDVLEIDVQGLFNCYKATSGFGSGRALDDPSQGGFVLHASVNGPRSSAAKSTYGVRLWYAESLQSSSGTPRVPRFSFVSDQAAYLVGHFNRVDMIPAAVMADTIHVLSSNWHPECKNLIAGSGSTRTESASLALCNVGSNSARGGAVTTTVNAAFLSGTDTTGDVEGTGGFGGAYNGGLENYVRFHENWSDVVLNYTGSLVSLGRPMHATGRWAHEWPADTSNSKHTYSAPRRNFAFNVAFSQDVANLPPVSPRAVYLKQRLFVRDFNKGDG